MNVTREKLFEEIWAEPMTKVAARYDVSSSFLARICNRLGLPTPARGYWAKLAVGRAPPKPTLPEARPGDELEWSRDGNATVAPLPLPKPPHRRRRTESPAHCPDFHALVPLAREHLASAKVSEPGYLVPSKRLLMDLIVTKAALDRALTFSNDLFVSLEARDHRVVLAPNDRPYQRGEIDLRGERKVTEQDYLRRARWHPARPTVAFFGTVAIGLTIFELSEETEVRYVGGTYVPISQVPARKSRYADQGWTTKRDLPTGRLCLRAFSPYLGADWEKSWRETAPGKLTESIEAIIRELERSAAPIATLVEEAERQAEIQRLKWEEQHRRWELEERERRQRENQKKSTEELLAIVDAWSLAKRIESFFDDIESRTADNEDSERQRTLKRVALARGLLGGIDASRRFSEWKSPDER